MEIWMEVDGWMIETGRRIPAGRLGEKDCGG